MSYKQFTYTKQFNYMVGRRTEKTVSGLLAGQLDFKQEKKFEFRSLKDLDRTLKIPIHALPKSKQVCIVGVNTDFLN